MRVKRQGGEYAAFIVCKYDEIEKKLLFTIEQRKC